MELRSLYHFVGCFGMLNLILKGSHTCDVIAGHIVNIYSHFRLDHTRITFAVTGNDSNMVKALAVYIRGQNRQEPEEQSDHIAGCPSRGYELMMHLVMECKLVRKCHRRNAEL